MGIFNLINFPAVIVAGFVAFFIGFFWYSELLFGKTWMKLAEISKKQAEQSKKKGMFRPALAGLITYIIMAGVLASFIIYVGKTPYTGAKVGFFAWLGFIGTTSLGKVLWENKSIKLYLFNNAYNLLVLVLMGLILGAW